MKLPEVNFKGFSVYPKFTYSDSLKYVESKTNFLPHSLL